MNDFNREITRQNIFLLLHYSGLSDQRFANILGISLRWLGYLKSGKYDFKIDEIEKVSLFFNQPFNTLTSKNLRVSQNLREELIHFHKNNIHYLKSLEDSPSIPYAIEFKLMKDPGFQNVELEVKQINAIFRKSGWNFKSSSVSNGLKSMDHLIKIRPHPTKKGTNLYSRRK